MAEQAAPPASPSARKLAVERGIDIAMIKGTGPGGKVTRADVEAAESGTTQPAVTAAPVAAAPAPTEDGITASPLARRIAAEKGIDLATVRGTGPNGKIVKEDVENFDPAAAAPVAASAPAPATGHAASPPQADTGSEPPFTSAPLNNVRKVIARRLTEAKQTIPHIYLTLDIRLDALLNLRRELNAALPEGGSKLSVNDMVIKALALALRDVPACNVSFRGDTLLQYQRQDISVAVAAPAGLVTPIIVDAGNKSLSRISADMKGLAEKARAGKLQPHEFQGGTATLSNLGMFGIKQFEAVINPPQAMILAVGAGESRPWVDGGEIVPATIMSATGSFDHRAIDGADGAQLMQRVQHLCEHPLSLVA